MSASPISHVIPLHRAKEFEFSVLNLQNFLPSSLHYETIDQTLIPELAKDSEFIDAITATLPKIPTRHYVTHGDAREMRCVGDHSVHLIVTTPPNWTLKRYEDGGKQMGHIEDYEVFLSELERVWRRCYEALVPGGRVICVVGDVCLSRRQNDGRHTVVPLHSSIQESCRKIGFDNLAPIIWHKISNAKYEAGGGGFLGKPYEPNSVIKNDIEFILMMRKPGGYRKPDSAARLLSVISANDYQKWFQQIWTGLTGESTKHHPAPYPLELASRLIRMFSFVGDVVLDPFCGTGTTTVAAAQAGRNSIGYEAQQGYIEAAFKRIHEATQTLFGIPQIIQEQEI